MSNEVFQAGYIERTIVEPVGISLPTPEVTPALPAVPEVAAEEKPSFMSYVPWVVAGVSVVFCIIAIVKKG